jgi:pyruvate carboxylase
MLLGARAATRPAPGAAAAARRATSTGAPPAAPRRPLPARRPVAAPAAPTTTPPPPPASAAPPPSFNDKGIVIDPAERTPFTRLLCANRGEIAVRVFRAGTELGLRTLAVYSSADRLQPHRYKADESYQVGEASASPVGAYLDVDAIIRIAVAQGVDAIHPGYGFLSENAAFARACGAAGIAFVGPLPETIDALGDKTAARRLATECGVPVVPGTAAATADAAAATAFAREAGFPVILKAAMGGGGRGMRVVRREEELAAAFEMASNEARAAFGDGRMFVEKLVEDPR